MSLKISIISLVFVMVSFTGFSQNLHLEGTSETVINKPHIDNNTTCNHAENVNYEKLDGALILAIIDGIDIKSGMVEIKVLNKLVSDNKLSHLFGPEIHQDLAGIIHTYSEHFSASFQALADSQPLSAYDEVALQRLESINSYYNRKLKVLIHKLIMDTNFGQDTAAIEQWMVQADSVLDALFDMWSDHLSSR